MDNNPALNFVRALALGATASLVAAPVVSAQEKDNILVIVVDDIGVDMIGAYGEGGNPPPTPNIDQLALNGVLFRNAWANPMCSTSRACMMTGRHSSRTGVGAVVPPSPGVRDSEMTIPRHLDIMGSGYEHAAIGKWHLSDLAKGFTAPNDLGWSHFAGFVFGFGNYWSWNRTVDGSTAISTQYATSQMVDDALAWIQTRSGPWVCFVSLASAHLPYHAPPAGLHTQSLAGLDPGTTPSPFYQAMVEAMDTEIGRLLAGVGPRTNVIFTSDNGTPGTFVKAPFPTGVGKGSPFEGGVNVPLIVSGPAVQMPGRESAALVSAVDMFSSVMDLAEIPSRSVLRGFDSVSFVPYLRFPGQPPIRQMVYAELFDPTAGVDFSCVRNSRYKLVEYRNGAAVADLLYDLQNDPFELNNLTGGALTPTEQSNLSQLLAEMNRIRDPQPSFVTYGPSSCQGTNGELTITGLGTPRLGGSYNILLSGAVGFSPATILIGASDRNWGPVPLPFPMGLISGGSNCWLLTSGEFAFTTSTDWIGFAVIPASLPPDPMLLGASIYHQWFVADPTAPHNPLGLVGSPGLEAIVGQ